ncbi:hypothetical protein GCM10020367_18960 [Streptomyces sannanensis]|uniref:TetR family transcriptional regulator n=1 Tax=Streptomyces sannanensis TaxID=285536 RepID=A0ABP6S8R4_9ACTN
MPGITASFNAVAPDCRARQGDQQPGTGCSRSPQGDLRRPIGLVRTTLDQTAAEGRISASASTEPTARALVAQLEDMVISAKLGNAPDLREDLWRSALLLRGTITHSE